MVSRTYLTRDSEMQNPGPHLELLNQNFHSKNFGRRYIGILKFEKHSMASWFLPSRLSCLYWAKFSHQGKNVSSFFGLSSSVPLLLRYHDCLDLSKETRVGYGEIFVSCLPLLPSKLYTQDMDRKNVWILCLQHRLKETEVYHHQSSHLMPALCLGPR